MGFWCCWAAGLLLEVALMSQTTLRVGDVDVTLTLSDAKAIEVALRGYLKTSDYPQRDELIQWTGPAFIDGDGSVRLGVWLLHAEGKDMVLSYRQFLGPQGGFGHKAYVTRQDGKWAIRDLVPVKIRGPVKSKAP
jgi:hypothetical protein